MRDNCCIRFGRFFLQWFGGLFILTPLAVLLFPLYRLNDGWKYLWRQSRFLSNPLEHGRKVVAVQDQVRAWAASGSDGSGKPRPRMCTARPAWASISIHNMDKRNLAQIELGELNCVVEVDEAGRSVTVEPGLKIGQLTSMLVPRGWTIPVVPEFESLSIGGLICGAGIESSSIRHGLFAETALEYEVVLASGEVTLCSADSHPDLFYSIPLSHGTIGFLTSVKLRLLKASKYVRVEYIATDSTEEAQTLMETPDHEFVEGLAYGRHKFVVMHGNFSDGDGNVNHINRWYKPFFYKHVETFLNRRARLRQGSKGPHVELIPLRDYYHRYTRAYFWVVPILLPFTTSRLFLLLFGWLFPFLDVNLGKRIGLALLGPFARGPLTLVSYFINAGQDFVIPMAHFKESMDFFHDLVGVYPLWLCPARSSNDPGMGHKEGVGLDSNSKGLMFFDIGIYGNVSKEALPAYDGIPTTKLMEEFVISKDGFQGTYSDMFLSREQFRTMFNMKLYDKVRADYGAIEAFPDVYDKVGKVARGIDV